MLTQEQKELRRHSLGSSEIAAVLNVDPHNTAANVWLSKRGMVDDFEGNDLTDRGIRLEPVLIDYAEHRTGRKFNRGVMVTHDSGLLHTNFDGIEFGETPACSVEAKTTTITEDWGTEETDEVPFKVIAQAHHGFVCMPWLRVCYVPVLLPGYRSLDFRLYTIPRDELLCDLIEEKSIEFMDKVKRGIQPDVFEPSIEVLKRMRRVPNKPVEIPDFLGEEFEEARRNRLEAEKLEKEAERKVLAVLGDGDAICYAGKEIPYVEMNRDGYEVKPCTYRQWKFPRARKQKKEEVTV